MFDKLIDYIAIVVLVFATYFFRELYTSLHQPQDIVFPIISKKATSF